MLATARAIATIFSTDGGSLKINIAPVLENTTTSWLMGGDKGHITDLEGGEGKEEGKHQGCSTGQGKQEYSTISSTRLPADQQQCFRQNKHHQIRA